MILREKLMFSGEVCHESDSKFFKLTIYPTFLFIIKYVNFTSSVKAASFPNQLQVK